MLLQKSIKRARSKVNKDLIKWKQDLYQTFIVENGTTPTTTNATMKRSEAVTKNSTATASLQQQINKNSDIKKQETRKQAKQRSKILNLRQPSSSKNKNLSRKNITSWLSSSDETTFGKSNNGEGEISGTSREDLPSIYGQRRDGYHGYHELPVPLSNANPFLHESTHSTSPIFGEDKMVTGGGDKDVYETSIEHPDCHPSPCHLSSLPSSNNIDNIGNSIDTNIGGSVSSINHISSDDIDNDYAASVDDGYGGVSGSLGDGKQSEESRLLSKAKTLMRNSKLMALQASVLENKAMLLDHHSADDDDRLFSQQNSGDISSNLGEIQGQFSHSNKDLGHHNNEQHNIHLEIGIHGDTNVNVETENQGNDLLQEAVNGHLPANNILTGKGHHSKTNHGNGVFAESGHGNQHQGKLNHGLYGIHHGHNINSISGNNQGGHEINIGIENDRGSETNGNEEHDIDSTDDNYGNHASETTIQFNHGGNHNNEATGGASHHGLLLSNKHHGNHHNEGAVSENILSEGNNQHANGNQERLNHNNNQGASELNLNVETGRIGGHILQEETYFSRRELTQFPSSSPRSSPRFNGVEPPSGQRLPQRRQTGPYAVRTQWSGT